MKTISLVGLLVLVGGVGGAAYAEFDRLTSASRNAQQHVFQLTRVYIQDEDKVTSAASMAVQKCARELHFIEFPPVLTEFLTQNAMIDYRIVRKHGSNAHKQKTEIEDMRNAVSSTYYDPIGEELDTLEPVTLKRVLQVMQEYNGNRTPMSRCIHRHAYMALSAEGAIES